MANSNDKISYFKIGTFVLVGMGLIVFALLIFGSSKIFQPLVYVETYFEESIQGISEGTPVKYRGLQIGYVKDIALTSEVYDGSKNLDRKMHSRSIYVKIAITSKLFTQLSNEELRQFLSTEVARGLRVKLVAQGLTGTSYLEFNYVDPKVSPLPTVDWTPEFFYVPAVTSTLTRLSENAQYIMNELKDVNFKRIFMNIDILANSLNRAATRTESLLGHVDNPAAKIIRNLNIITDNLRVISERIKLKPSDVIFSSYPPPLDPSKL